MNRTVDGYNATSMTPRTMKCVPSRKTSPWADQPASTDVLDATNHKPRRSALKVMPLSRSDIQKSVR